MKHIILGGGFSGLTMAYALCKRGVAVEVHESSGRLGGLINTHQESWGLVETAANGIMASKNVVEMFHDLSLEYECPKRKNKKRYIFRGRPRMFPLTAGESLKLLKGFFKRDSPNPKESFYDFGQRCFGSGATDYLLEPALFGIFGVDSRKLSATLVHDYFFKYKPRPSREAKGTLAPKAGMAALVGALGKYIEGHGGSIVLNSQFRHGDSARVFVATPAYVASEILRDKHPDLAKCLSQVEYTQLSSVTLGFENKARKLKGFGCLFPRSEAFHALGVLFNGDIFPDRGPSETETWMIKDTESSDQTILERLVQDRERLLGIRQWPDHHKIQRWPRALPLYSVQLEQILSELQLPQNLYLVGNYMGRLGLSKILDQNLDLANRVFEK